MLRSAKRVLLVLALLVANVWPALYNGQPFFYADTSAYIRGIDAGFHRLIHRSTAWSQNETGTSASLSSIHDKAVLSGRSIYYGALLYLGDLSGRLWPVAFMQSAVVLIAIAFTLRALALFTWLRLTILSLVLAAVTPMPFFVSLLIPDIFAAITILAIANLLMDDCRKPLWPTILWTALLSAALLFHVSDMLIAVALFALWTPTALLLRVRLPRVSLIAILCSLAVGFIGEAIFRVGVEKLIGEPPLRPPILMARLIADGPGYRYLRKSCPASGFEVCRFLDRLPLDLDQFVWSTNVSDGVFAVSDPDTRRALSNEQYRFAWAVFRFDPLGEVADFVRRAGAQITRIGYEEFNYDSGAHGFFRTHLPEGYYNAMTGTRAWKDGVPGKVLSFIAILATSVALFYVAYVLIIRRAALVRSRPLLIFVSLVCAGVLVNGAVCALSATHDRYQTRVIWLIPFCAMLLYLKPVPSASSQSKT